MIDTKALRQKVLDLAIRGKLVPQDPNDEPASVLLERIRKQKQQMVKDGKLKAKDIKNDTVIFVGEDNLHYEKFAEGSVKCIEDEIPFDLPDGWAWCNLGLLFSHNTGKALNSSNGSGTQLEYITTSNVYWNRFELDHLKTMPFTDDEIEKCTIQKGDLLVCEGGDIGRSAIWSFDRPIRIQNHLHRLRAYDKVNTKFYYYVLYLYKLNGKINGNGIGLQGLSSNALHAITVPVPPTDEQERIADQISQLLETVDVIDAQKDDLSSCISQAKSKILDLAIRGQLVSQSPDDEPASVLLDRIRAEKEELMKQGKIKRDKKESVIFKGEDNSYYEKIGDTVICIDEEILFDLPDNWCWTRLKSISDIVMGSSPQSTNVCADEKYMEFHQGKIFFSDYIIGNSHQYTKEITKVSECGSVLLCVRAPVGEVNITDRDICIGRGLASIHPSSEMDVALLYHWLQSYKKELNNKATGSTFSAITIDVVKNLLVPIPPKQEQLKILLAINESFETLNTIEASLA